MKINSRKIKEIWGAVYVAQDGVNPDKWKPGKVPGIDRGRDENPAVKEIGLEGKLPARFNPYQIVSYGEEDIGDEAGLYVIYSSGVKLEIQGLQNVRKFFLEVFPPTLEETIAQRIWNLAKKHKLDQESVADYIEDFGEHFEPEAYEGITDKDLLKDVRLYLKHAI